MPSDCYEVFKQTYEQAIADGLATSVATAAAQTAMAACLAQQNSRPSTVATPLQPVRSGRVNDPGPRFPEKPDGSK